MPGHQRVHEQVNQVDETRLWPGHDYADKPVAAMGEVRRANPYFSFPDVASFVAYRMRPRR